MNSRTSALLAVLRKDLRLFWPLAALVGALLLVWQIPPIVTQIGAIAGLVQVVAELGTILLVLVLLYEDAVVSVNHDWLTRPIPGTTLLCAKIVFLVLAIFVPSILGALAWNLYQRHGLGESLLAGLASGLRFDSLLHIIMIMAFAAVTTGIRQAIIVALIGAAGIAGLSMLVGRAFADEPTPAITYSGWMIRDGVLFFLTLGAVLIAWIQYRYRHTMAARFIAAAAVTAGLLVFMPMTWPRVFAIQKNLSRDPASAALVKVAVAEGCFPSREMYGAGRTRNGGERIRPESFMEGRLEHAGPNALAFSTRLLQQSVPEGHRLEVDYIEMSYRVDGRVVAKPGAGRLPMKVDSGRDLQPATDTLWLLTENDQHRLASMPDVESHFIYSLSLLEPAASTTLTVGAARRYVPGIGYCSVTSAASPGVVDVDCFKPGIQPAQLVAVVDGGKESIASTSRRTDFTPAALELWGGEHYHMTLLANGLQTPRVRLTAYEPRAHFDREIDVPGVLGGSLSLCPIYTPSGENP